MLVSGFDTLETCSRYTVWRTEKYSMQPWYVHMHKNYAPILGLCGSELHDVTVRIFGTGGAVLEAFPFPSHCQPYAAVKGGDAGLNLV